MKVAMRSWEELVPYACSECGGRNIIHDEESGEIICGGCGLVIAESSLCMGPEWRAFTMEERGSRSRAGMPPSFAVHDKGLSTVIRVGRDAQGRRLPTETKIKMLRLRRWQVRSGIYGSVDRNLAQAMSELNRLSDRLHIPPFVQETAAAIYRKALKRGLVRGRSIAAIVAVSLYVACRLTQTPRTLRELARHSPIDKKDIARCYRLLLRELSLRVPVAKAHFRVPRIAAAVGICEKTQRRAVEILVEAGRLRATVGKDPMGLAAAALYIACVENGEKQTQKAIADAAGVTEVTIRNRYKKLKKALEPGAGIHGPEQSLMVSQDE